MKPLLDTMIIKSNFVVKYSSISTREIIFLGQWPKDRRPGFIILKGLVRFFYWWIML